ncbi:hypothetical protein CBW65_15950 [Tumebacillus avium]|uniref:ABC3 transporter permease protein domain-containing protein n=1 Tax=Tumebacillus avium TaxID=1903704 RepID=A0A1Y0IR49_9BACL|nr:ABC transporter permease [Tumebacillus avium]ARU62316.1 hypothetical protein CBW65_15950 [Tumebacillus avium]
MLYLWEQALQQLKRRKGKSWLLWIQLFLSLLIIQAALGMYQSKQQEYEAYRDSFGSDLYQISVSWIGGTPPNPEQMAEAISSGQFQMLKQQSAGRYEVYQANNTSLQVDGVAEQAMLIEMDESLYNELVRAMGYDSPSALISPVLQAKLPAQVQLGQHRVLTTAAEPLKREVLDTLSPMYRFLPDTVIVLPVATQTVGGARQIWLKAMPDFKAADRARLLKSLHELGGQEQWEYSYQQVLEVQEEQFEQARQFASMFLVFAGMILLIGTLGVLGINLINFLSKRHEWAVHMVYGASRGDLIMVQLLQYLIIGGTAWLTATGCAKIFLSLNAVESAWRFGLGDGAALLSVTVVGICTLLPFFGLRQVRLTDALKQER